MTIKFTNNATSTLASSINDSVTSLSVASGQGGLFPTLSGADVFYVTLSNTAGAVEIVKVTARSTDAFTIVRAQDSTSALSWTAGDKVELRATAIGLASMAQTANNLSDLASASTARTNLGLGTIATQAASSVSITGGSIAGITDLAVADGGTGASTLTSGGYLKGAGTSAITSQTGIPAGDITSGTVGTARLGSGTASSSTYLRGDSTWATVSGGVTSITAGNGLSGGTITTTGTLAIAAPSAGSIGSYILADNNSGYSTYGTSYSTVYTSNYGSGHVARGGTWLCLGSTGGVYNAGCGVVYSICLFVRVV